VLADVREHDPCDARPFLGWLLDERDVAPRRRAERARVVVGHPGEIEAVVAELVPLLASDLTSLAPDADRRIGEEALGHSFTTAGSGEG
jgi:hypothetical protein